MTTEASAAQAAIDSRPRLDHETRQQQITQACARLIARRGYAATSMRDVASEVGISTGTLMHHMQSKVDLLTATLLSVADEVIERMETAAQASDDPVEQLRLVVRALLGEGENVDLCWRVWLAFWHEASINPELASIASDMTMRSEQLIAGLITSAIEAGALHIEGPEERAAELAALIDGVAIRVYGETGRWSHDRAISLVELVIDSWR
jgi:AcrR family transcriptional regulator